MAERADLKSKEFQHKIEFRLRHRVIPVIRFIKNKYRTEFFWRYKWANRNLKNSLVLEIPCGLGWGTKLLKSAKTVYAVDIDLFSMLRAKEICTKKNKVVFSADMCFLPFPDCGIDAVCCLEGIEHISRQSGKLFIDECYRVLKTNGKLLISSPHGVDGQHSGNPYHLHEYTSDELEFLLEGQFTIDEIISRQLDNLIIHYCCCTKK